MDVPLIFLLIVLGIYAVCDWQAVRVWRSEPSLWAQAYRVSPTGPRSASNHAKFLYTSGREADGRRVVAGIRP